MTTPRPGDTIEPTRLRARWAYAELTSNRFGSSFQTLVSQGIWSKAVKRVPFSDLDEREVDCLVAALNIHPDRGGMACALDQHKEFQCVEWTASQLLQTVTVPGLGWLPLTSLACPSTEEEQSLRNKVDNGSPSGEPFEQSEPIIVVCGAPWAETKGSRLLLEGTSRSLWFLSKCGPCDRILVWLGT